MCYKCNSDNFRANLCRGTKRFNGTESAVRAPTIFDCAVYVGGEWIFGGTREAEIQEVPLSGTNRVYYINYGQGHWARLNQTTKVPERGTS